MQKITPFFMFSENAVEAMDYYVSVFKDGKVVKTMPGPDGKSAGGTFEIYGQQFHCYTGGPQFTFSQGISLMVSAETQEEIDHLYDTLAEGGEKQQCGWVRDKYGVSWQIIPPVLGELIQHPDRDKAGRAINAMLGMQKIDIQALKEAAGE